MSLGKCVRMAGCGGDYLIALNSQGLEKSYELEEQSKQAVNGPRAFLVQESG